MSTFDSFDRLAMSEAQFLRIANAELHQTPRPALHRGPSFAEKYLWKSPSLGKSSIRSTSTSPALSTSTSPKPSGDTFFGVSAATSPGLGAGWGLGIVFRKSGTASTASSPSIGGRTPTLGSESPRLGGGNVQMHKRRGSGSSEGEARDGFGLVREERRSQMF